MTAELFERLPLEVNDVLWHRNFKNEFPRGSVHARGKHSVHTSPSSITARVRVEGEAGGEVGRARNKGKGKEFFETQQ